MSEVVYFGVEWAIREHRDVMVQSGGGLEGIMKPKELPSLFEFIQIDYYYPTFEEKLTFLVHSLVKNHYFLDGNKRSAIAIGAYFIKVNGHDAVLPYFMEVMEDAVLCLADNLIGKDELKDFLIDILYAGSLSNDSKLLLYKALLIYKEKYPQFYIKK